MERSAIDLGRSLENGRSGCRSSREIHAIGNSCRSSLRDTASFREARNFFAENYELRLCKMPPNCHSLSYRCLKTLLENYLVEIKTRERKICIGTSATIVSDKESCADCTFSHSNNRPGKSYRPGKPGKCREIKISYGKL